MRRFAAFAIAGALALAVAPAVVSAGSAPALRQVAPPFVHASVVFVPPPIPVPRFEVVTAYPGYGQVWVPGYWAWRGRPYGYHWVHGGWHRPPRHGAYWVAPHWSHGHGGHRWVGGHWRHGAHGWQGRGWHRGHR
jgi:hypothetical protein